MRPKSEILVKIEDGHLAPVSHFDALSIRSQRDGTIFALEPFRDTKKKARLFHMLLRRVADNATDEIVYPDRLKAELFKALGFTKGTMTEVDGTSYEVRLSTNELSHDQLDLLIEALLMAAERLCPGIDVTKLKKEAESDAAPQRRG